MDYYTYNIIGSGRSTIRRGDVTSWLNRQGITSSLLLGMFMRPFEEVFSAAQSSGLHYFNVSDVLQTLVVQNTLCNRGGDGNITGANCACSRVTSAGSLKCPAGYVCTSSVYSGLTSMMYDNPLLHTTRSICVVCRPGDYCPFGSVLQDETPSSYERLKCPVGHYCPSPSIKTRCANGTFCNTGFYQELTCNYSQLLRVGTVPKRQDTVFERLFKHNDPYTGNICLEDATTPESSCPGGFYCPSPSEKIQCPSGYFCRPKSTKPTPCPRLSTCGKGSKEPETVITPYLFASLMVIIMVVINLSNLIRSTKCLLNGWKLGLENSSSPGPPLRSVYGAVRNVYGELYSHASSQSPSHTSEQFRITPLVRLELQNVGAPWLARNNARFASCKLNAIIGASGCGKSTFLDLLRGNIPNGKLTGVVYAKLEGHEDDIMLEIDKIQRHTQWSAFQSLKKFRGYVPQDDVVYGELTVRENLKYSALIRLRDKGVDVDQLVQYVIDALGMTAVADKIVGTVERRGISGGQRKRVNIGMEVVTLPSLLIMDEPTSGLDAHGCQQLIEFCKVLTHMNMTVVAVVHQPRYTSFMLFDQVTLLSKYGTIFEGPPASSLLYFMKGMSFEINKNENPADVIMDILSGSKGLTPQELVDAWRQTGQTWVDHVCNEYPLHHDILDNSVCYDTATRTVMNELLHNHTETDAVDVVRFLRSVGVSVSNRDAQEYKRKYPQHIQLREFKRIMQEVCSAAIISHGYDNVIDRIRLFKNLPDRFRKDEEDVDVDPVRQVFLAHKFGKRMLGDRRHNNVDPLNSNNKLSEDCLTLVFHDELLLASMTCKAFHDYKKRNQITKIIEQLKGSCLSLLGKSVLITIMCRRLQMMYRSPWPIQLLVPITAAFIVGRIQGYTTDLQQYPNEIVSALVCMGVLSMITHVRSLTLDKVTIRREAEGNVGMFPFFVAYNITDLLWVFLVPVCFMIPYYYLTYPSTSFGKYLGVGVMICWWTSGCAYIVSSLPLAMHWATLISVFVSVIFGAFLQGLSPTIHESKNTFQGALIHMSFNRWAMEILSLEEFMKHDQQHTNTVWSRMDSIGLCGLDGTLFDGLDSTRPSLRQILRLSDLLQSSVADGCMKYVQNAYLWLFGYGCMFRLIALCVFYYNLHPVWARFHWSLFKI